MRILSMLRLAAGILVGFLVSTGLIIGVEIGTVRLFSMGEGGIPTIPETTIIAINLGISIGFGLLGGWLAATVVRGREMAAGAGLAAIRLLAFAASAPNVRGRQPEWYLITLLVIGIATALLGAWIVARRRRLKRTEERDGNASVLQTARE
jgi:hypothetical protein